MLTYVLLPKEPWSLSPYSVTLPSCSFIPKISEMIFKISISLFLFMCMCLWVYVHYMPTCDCRGQRARETLKIELQVTVSLLMWVLGLNTGPLEEQNTLLTTEHLSSCLWNSYYISWVCIELSKRKCSLRLEWRAKDMVMPRNSYGQSEVFLFSKWYRKKNVPIV